MGMSVFSDFKGRDLFEREVTRGFEWGKVDARGVEEGVSVADVFKLNTGEMEEEAGDFSTATEVEVVKFVGRLVILDKLFMRREEVLMKRRRRLRLIFMVRFYQSG